MPLVINTGNASFKSDLENLFETLQQHRSTWLETTRDTLLAARLLALAEARRLESEAGEGAQDARVARLRAGGEAIARRAAALEVEQQIAAIRTPPVAKSDTLLQGRITDESSKAAGQLSVTLIDEKGAPVTGVAPAVVDDSGYYAFVLNPQQVEAIGATRPLMLLVSNDDGKLVPAAAKPFTLASGKATVSETRLQPAELEKLRLRAGVKEARPVARKSPAGATKKKPAVKKPAEKSAPTPRKKR